jgi:hypothetical protein
MYYFLYANICIYWVDILSAQNMYVSFILNAEILLSTWISASKGCKNKLLRNVHEKKTAYFEAFFPIYLQFFKKREQISERHTSVTVEKYCRDFRHKYVRVNVLHVTFCNFIDLKSAVNSVFLKLILIKKITYPNKRCMYSTILPTDGPIV